MATRTGRPKVDNPKTFRFSVCLDAETVKKLQAYSEENEITKGEAIRKAIIQLLRKKK